MIAATILTWVVTHAATGVSTVILWPVGKWLFKKLAAFVVDNI